MLPCVYILLHSNYLIYICFPSLHPNNQHFEYARLNKKKKETQHKNGSLQLSLFLIYKWSSQLFRSMHFFAVCGVVAQVHVFACVSRYFIWFIKSHNNAKHSSVVRHVLLLLFAFVLLERCNRYHFCYCFTQLFVCQLASDFPAKCYVVLRNHYDVSQRCNPNTLLFPSTAATPIQLTTDTIL